MPWWTTWWAPACSTSARGGAGEVRAAERQANSARRRADGLAMVLVAPAERAGASGAACACGQLQTSAPWRWLDATASGSRRGEAAVALEAHALPWPRSTLARHQRAPSRGRTRRSVRRQYADACGRTDSRGARVRRPQSATR
jgi:hypothetical protein